MMKKSLLLLAAASALGLGACGVVQSPECAQWIECQAAVDQVAGTTTAETLDASYGESGSCWAGSAETAESCTAACVQGIDSLWQSYPDIEECNPDREG